MRRLREVTIILVFSAISLVGLTSANAENSKPETAPKPPTGDQFQIMFNQAADGNTGEHFSYQVNASTVNDPGRPLPHYRSILPVCQTPQEITCIESVEGKKFNETNWVKATLSANQLDEKKIRAESRKGYFDYGTWPADESTGLAAGGAASSWELPKTPHSNGASYLAIVQYLGQFNNGMALTEFSAMIEPWSWECVAFDSCNYIGIQTGSRKNSFPEDVEFRMTIRTNFLSGRIGTWAVGRLGKPTVNLTAEKLTISGSPVTYPMGYATMESRSECNQKVGSIFKRYSPIGLNLCTYTASAFSTDSNDLSALDLFQAVDQNVVQNGKITRWTFANVKSVNANNKCLNAKNFSLATSNAMLYSVQPPIWDDKTGTLSYRLASTHADSDGSINKGNYSLALSKRTADCLWNFDTQKASAVISITNSEGVQNIAVSTLRTTANWIYFDASGFTFSSPQIKVKLVNPETQIKVKTISCVKGSIIKKISGKSPSCPNGYKIKK